MYEREKLQDPYHIERKGTKVDFNEAVDRLTGKKVHLFGRLAHRMGFAETYAYRFRMDNSKKSYIAPPPNWQNAMLEVAIDYLNEYRQFVLDLQYEVNKKEV